METQDETPQLPASGDDVLSVSPDEGSGENAELEVDGTEEVEKVNSNIIRYSKEFIMHLKNAPLSRQRPVVTDKSPNCFKWLDKKRSDTDEDKNGLNEKRRPGDPRERLRKESEGIVLSPQRKSFISGCHIASGNGAVSAGNRDVLDNPIFLQGSDPVTSKADIGTRGLRAGSARISRDTNPWERGGDGDSDYIYRPPGASRERDDRYERRSFGRDLYNNDKNHRSDRDSDGRFSDRKDSYRDDSKRGGRYDRRRTSEKEEPEWFSSGPTSQHDTIELRGFDDPIPTPPPTSKGKDSVDSNGNNANSSESSANVKSRPNRRAAGSGRTPSAVAASQAKEQPPITDEEKENTIKENESKDESRDSNSMNKMDTNAPDFLDAFFKMDSIPGLLMNGEIDENQESRFSRWFKRDSPPVNNQDANIKDSLFPDMLKDPSISVFTSEPHHVFAPISPAENTNSSSTPAPNALLEMLCRVQKSNDQRQVPQQQLLHLKNAENVPGKMHNLEELEARMRSMPVPGQQHVQQILPHGPPRQPQHHNFQPQPDDEFSKFLRLMNQGSSGFPNNIPQKQHMQQPQQQQPQHANILQMLNKSQKPEHHVPIENHQVPVTHDLLRLLQVQNQDTNKMMHHSGRHYQVSPIPTETQGFINNMQPSRDLLQRPEAQTIIQGLRQGKITVQHLMEQLNSPGLASRQRELLGTIINFTQQPQQQMMQSAPSPRNRLNLPPPQQLRVSPLPPNAYCVSPIMATSPNTLAVHPAIPQRIPSPRELQAHTQSIMQGALIKKKLEEQRENFRRRQEQAGPQAQPPVPGPHPNTPSASSPNKHQNNALGFTPTSVLRKMTAEKECDPTVTSGAKAAGWGAPPSHLTQVVAPKQGRPIVKGSSSVSVGHLYQQMPGDFPSQYSNPPHQQTQQLFNNIQQGPPPQGRPIRPAGANSNNAANLSSQPHGGNLVMSLQCQPQQHQQMYHPQHFQGHNRSQITGSNPLQFMMQQKNEHGRNMAPALSPTSNQLARWFSPELLAQANAGKLPSVNMAQNVLSLEELERMQHNEAIVHN